MGDLLYTIHPIIVHFPVALLICAIVFAIAARWWPQLGAATWVLQLTGTLFTIPAVITGLIAHEPYESTSLAEVIENHEWLGFSALVFFGALAAWRWRGRRAANDPINKPVYLGALVLGLVLLAFLGYTGGALVFEHGVNVRGVNPLLKP